ncbi:hypothetical protein AGR4A_Cc30066 [Agrobacterium tumefaciens str. B6]|uniref:Uncharacterized protein n=1 Tax=Agrobacterium tumefaciens str. B6 TaxID=1183423 RepID=A0A822V2N7_AGRTU|nr:hypothetical protein AGR4A_Cc30066 [Agrobacterium tumefaciens str. B6]
MMAMLLHRQGIHPLFAALTPLLRLAAGKIAPYIRRITAANTANPSQGVVNGMPHGVPTARFKERRAWQK